MLPKQFVTIKTPVTGERRQCRPHSGDMQTNPIETTYLNVTVGLVKNRIEKVKITCEKP